MEPTSNCVGNYSYNTPEKNPTITSGLPEIDQNVQKIASPVPKRVPKADLDELEAEGFSIPTRFKMTRLESQTSSIFKFNNTKLTLEDYSKRILDSLKFGLSEIVLKSIMEDMKKAKIEPTTEIYNHILKRCILEHNRKKIEFYFKEMFDRKIKANTETFTILIKYYISINDYASVNDLIRISTYLGIKKDKELYNTLVLYYYNTENKEKLIYTLISMKADSIEMSQEIESKLPATFSFKNFDLFKYLINAEIKKWPVPRIRK